METRGTVNKGTKRVVSRKPGEDATYITRLQKLNNEFLRIHVSGVGSLERKQNGVFKLTSQKLEILAQVRKPCKRLVVCDKNKAKFQ